MISEVLRFAAAGNDELILVFDGHTPADLEGQIRRFSREVIAPAAERYSAPAP
jgi:hypothetical protein